MAGFLTAILQHHARQIQVSIDSLSFEFEVSATSAETDDSLGEVKTPLSVKELAFKVGGWGMNLLVLDVQGRLWNTNPTAASKYIPSSVC